MNHLEVRHLKLVTAIADQGSVTGAANHLNLTQSALSHQLRDIEERLGAPLFHRRSKRMFAMTAICLCAPMAVAAQTHRAKAGGDGLLERAFSGKARVIELSHDLSANTPTFGGERDAFRYEKLSEIDRDGYASGAVRLPEHFGTHVDSPGHFIKGAATIDRLDVRRFIAPVVVIDIRKQAQQNADYRLTVADIQAWERAGRIADGAANRRIVAEARAA